MDKVRIVNFSIKTISTKGGIIHGRGERFAISGKLTPEKKEAIIKILNEEGDGE